jgi:hypothetical protein
VRNTVDVQCIPDRGTTQGCNVNDAGRDEFLKVLLFLFSFGDDNVAARCRSYDFFLEFLLRQVTSAVAKTVVLQCCPVDDSLLGFVKKRISNKRLYVEKPAAAVPVFYPDFLRSEELKLVEARVSLDVYRAVHYGSK